MKKLTLIILILIFVSCDKKIDEKYIINEANLKDNTSVLNNIHKQLEALYSKQEGKQKLAAEQDVTIRDSVKKIFDPEFCPCSLPDKIAKKLNKLKDDKKGWAPEEVNTFLAQFPAKGKRLQGSSVNDLLHTVKIKSVDGTTRTWPLAASPSYKEFDVEKYLYKKSKSFFLYTLDCSGFLNAAITASAAVPGADITTKAQSALEKQKSMFVGGGTLISPINSAYYGEAFSVSYSVKERILILDALLNIPDTEENDELIISNSYEVIWISQSGSSSFNGGATISGGAGAGIGVASITSKGEAGAEISRKSSFNSYDTYITANKAIPDLKPFTIKQVRERKKILEDSNQE